MEELVAAASLELMEGSQWEQGRALKGMPALGYTCVAPLCRGWRECLSRQLLLRQLQRAQLSRWLRVAQEASMPQWVYFPGQPQSELSSLHLHSQLLLWYCCATW